MKKVFFSYTLRDGEINHNILLKLKKRMEYLNIDTYIDILDNDSIKEPQKRVIQEVKSADLVCVICTTKIETSMWVQKEIRTAQEYELPISLISIDILDYIIKTTSKNDVLNIFEIYKLEESRIRQYKNLSSYIGCNYSSILIPFTTYKFCALTYKNI